MILSRVLGNVVSTTKHAAYTGRKVMVVQPLSPEGEPQGKSFLAVDAVQSGPGDQVLVSREGNTVRQILGTQEAPLHAVILSIVDHVELS